MKATNELCTRTFAVHTLKSPPTKILYSPTGGANPPRRGPPVAPSLLTTHPQMHPDSYEKFKLALYKSLTYILTYIFL